MLRLRLFACFLVVCLSATVTVTRSQGAVDVQIDVAANRHPIDPRIYGVAFADASALSDLRMPLHRWGGNPTTRHNWQANASNRASDWYFESISDGSSAAGASADSFISASKTAGAEPIITIPMIGWVAKLGPNRQNLASFSIAKYGAQTGADWQFFPDAGNGVSAATGQNIVGNDPNDASVASDATFQRGWVQHLTGRWGTSTSGGVRYYALDNEPSIWHNTHRDVHPNGASMDEVFNASVAYATQIKSVDPGARVMGPEEWGWSGYLYSGRDLQWGAANGWNNLPDRSSHGNTDYVAWFLAQMRQRDSAAGQRLLDIFSLHYYPQGGEFGSDTSTAMQQRRNRSTRSLWDPNYVDESWIGTQVRLIPRMKGWVAANYPGTEVGITEYNWGAEGHINGATAQADILGIFGRESLDLATFWTIPAASTPTYKAIKLYRNYDGQGSGFGDTSVSAVAPNPDSLSVFAAQRGTGALTVMAINKDLSNSPAVNLRLANFSAGGPVQVWRLTSSNTITRLADTSVSAGTLGATLPVQSITLFVIPGGGSQQPPPSPQPPTNLRIVTGSQPPPAGVGVWTNVTPAGFSLDPNYGGSSANFGVQDIVVDPVRPSDLYATSTWQGLWKSTNYGLTWAKISTGQNGAGLNGKMWTLGLDPNRNRNPATPPTVYTTNFGGSAGMGLWKSVNGGVDWSRCGNVPLANQDVYTVDINPYDSQHLIIGYHEAPGLAESLDGCASWRSISAAPPGTSMYPFFIDTGNAATTRGTWLTIAQASGATYRTTNQGGSFTRVSTLGHAHGCAQIFQAGGGVVYMAGLYGEQGNGVYRSTDYGATWTRVNDGAQQNGVVATPNYIYATYGWATNGTQTQNLQRAPRNPGTSWSTYMSTPSGFNNGAKGAAVTFDGSRYIIVSGNWLSGFWRYVE